MPTKHVDDNNWKKVQDMTVKAVIATRKPIKEGAMLNYLIKKGLKEIKEEEFNKI